MQKKRGNAKKQETPDLKISHWAGDPVSETPNSFPGASSLSFPETPQALGLLATAIRIQRCGVDRNRFKPDHDSLKPGQKQIGCQGPFFLKNRRLWLWRAIPSVSFQNIKVSPISSRLGRWPSMVFSGVAMSYSGNWATLVGLFRRNGGQASCTRGLSNCLDTCELLRSWISCSLELPLFFCMFYDRLTDLNQALSYRIPSTASSTVTPCSINGLGLVF